MLEWKEIKGYDRRRDYKSQLGVELPELNEEIIISFVDETRPNRAPFVGRFSQNINGEIWMIISANDGMTLFEVQDGIKWARFNRP